jgi:CHAD domain-containing protein
VAFVECPPVERRVGHERARGAARDAVERSYRRVHRYARRLGKHPAEVDLHELRKRVKRARYAAELVEPVLRGDTRRFAKRLESLQSDLGHRQDAVTARAWLGSLPLERATVAEGFAAGQLHERLVHSSAVRSPSWRTALRRAHRVRPR